MFDGIVRTENVGKAGRPAAQESSERHLRSRIPQMASHLGMYGFRRAIPTAYVGRYVYEISVMD